jgi:hypothetical protein
MRKHLRPTVVRPRIVTDLDPGLFAAVLEVLRVAADYRALTDAHTGAETGIAFDGGMRTDPRARSDRHTGSDDGKGADHDLVTQLGAGINE